MGPRAGLAALAHKARREALPNICRLLPVARAAGVKVAHCLVQRRADGLGAKRNAKIFALGRNDVQISRIAIARFCCPSSGPNRLTLPELGPKSTDIVSSRWHGVGPMGGTELNPILRNLGVSTPVAVGVSLNIAIPNLVMDAVNAGYGI